LGVACEARVRKWLAKVARCEGDKTGTMAAASFSMCSPRLCACTNVLASNESPRNASSMLGRGSFGAVASFAGRPARRLAWIAASCCGVKSSPRPNWRLPPASPRSCGCCPARRHDSIDERAALGWRQHRVEPIQRVAVDGSLGRGRALLRAQARREALRIDFRLLHLLGEHGQHLSVGLPHRHGRRLALLHERFDRGPLLCSQRVELQRGADEPGAVPVVMLLGVLLRVVRVGDGRRHERQRAHKRPEHHRSANPSVHDC